MAKNMVMQNSVGIFFIHHTRCIRPAQHPFIPQQHIRALLSSPSELILRLSHRALFFFLYLAAALSLYLFPLSLHRELFSDWQICSSIDKDDNINYRAT